MITNVAGDHLDYFEQDAAAYARARPACCWISSPATPPSCGPRIPW
ncbi:MAG: hypothetical protein R3F60_31145 [bacterium]